MGMNSGHPACIVSHLDSARFTSEIGIWDQLIKTKLAHQGGQHDKLLMRLSTALVFLESETCTDSHTHNPSQLPRVTGGQGGHLRTKVLDSQVYAGLNVFVYMCGNKRRKLGGPSTALCLIPSRQGL